MPAEKKILKQKGDYIYFTDKTKMSIDEYRRAKGLKPRKGAKENPEKKEPAKSN